MLVVQTPRTLVAILSEPMERNATPPAVKASVLGWLAITRQGSICVARKPPLRLLRSPLTVDRQRPQRRGPSLDRLRRSRGLSTEHRQLLST